MYIFSRITLNYLTHVTAILVAVIHGETVTSICLQQLLPSPYWRYTNVAAVECRKHTYACNNFVVE